MDISKLDVVKYSNEGYRFLINNPKTGKDTDIAITIKGYFADGYREVAGDTVKGTADLMAKFTIGWENVEENGKELPFTVENAARVYANFPVIYGQVLATINNIKNFIKD